MREFVIKERRKAKLVRSTPGIGDESLPERAATASELPARGFMVVTPLKARSEAPKKAPPSPRPVHAPRSASRAPRRGGQSQFMVSYAGSFVGFFEAEGDITPRKAFLRVAADLAAADDAFDSEKLDLYKPVLLRGARPPQGCPRVKGKLTRVPAKRKPPESERGD